MRRFNIDKGLVQVIQELYRKTTSAVLPNGQQGDFVRTLVDAVRDLCSLPSCSRMVPVPLRSKLEMLWRRKGWPD
ncbi:hypothetical protein DPMN_124059 [Dreissena polymorpha]|uniref:Uncharacterized protein n=1 Tax=Dreissena polymorpha TaxID=45954 RepID=A0A9D4GVF8_DREPO|nr:hypothetical protein DPMN_124059 [Dreissena polymorpha]